MNKCKIQLAGLSQDSRRIIATIEFFAHTVLNGIRADPTELTIWIGPNLVMPAERTPERIIDGVSRVKLEGVEILDRETMPLIVEADFSGITCSYVGTVQPAR